MRSLRHPFSTRVLALFLCLLLLSFHLPFTAFAQGELTGIVQGTGVRVRTTPRTDVNNNILHHNGSVVFLNLSHPLVILQSGVADAGGGNLSWYQVRFLYDNTTYEGYIRSDLVTVNQVNDAPSQDVDFEEKLKAFPESYRGALRSLHDAHPAWIFEAYNTGLDWTAVQTKENELGRSFTNAGILSYYSTAPGSYDWATDTYFMMERGGWYQAAPSLVAYFMDPRNFLNESDIFQFELLSFNEAVQTELTIDSMLQGTFMAQMATHDPAGNLISMAQAFLDAGRSAGISSFHLVSRCIQEVGRGGQDYSKGQYPGYEGFFNFFNIGSTTELGPLGGMMYAKNAGWDTAYKAIVGGAAFIGNDYIAAGQNTPYFQKWDVADPNDFGSHQYMTNVAAPRSEGQIQYGEYKEMGALDRPFVFRIPVFLNMPESACQPPAAAGSPNNLLTNLFVEGYALTPTFDFYESLNQGITEFTLVINGNVPTLNVGATAASATATLSGSLGTVPIWTGENTLTITCRSASGVAKNYTIRVILNGQGSGGQAPNPQPPSQPDPQPQPIPSGWNPASVRIQGSQISGIAPGTPISHFIAGLGTYGRATATVTDENGTPLSDGAIRTGLVLHYYDGTNTTQFQLVLFGDTNKDASIDAIDLLVIRRNLLGITALDPSATTAADVNHDGRVDAIDLLLVRRTLLGLSSITQ